MRGNKIGNLTGNFQLYPCYYVLDHLNGVDRIVDESGEVVERYEYTAYGEATLFDNQSNEITESRVGNPYGFQGRRYDPESNLMYFRNRMYSPEMKRFISMDPLGFVDSMNLYETFGCDPVNIIDRFGLSEPYSLGYEMARIRILEIEKGLYRGGYASPIFVSKLKDVPKELLGGLLPKYVAVRIGPVSRGKVSIINAWLEPWGNKGKGEIFGKIAEALKKINEVSEKVDLIEKYISLMKNAFTWSAAKTPWVRLRITGRIKYKKYIWNRLMRGKEKWTRAGIFSRIEMKEKIQPVDDAGLGIMILANPLEWEVFRGKIQNLLDQTWGDFSESKFLPLEKGDPSFY